MSIGSVASLARVTLRAVESSDVPLLFAVYASTREEELAQVDWAPDQKRAFLWQQFSAQDRYYRENYPGATFDVVLRDDEPAGRLYVARWADEIRIMDVAMLPAHRNAGIGGGLIRSILDEGSRTGKRVTIHVEVHNRAARLYHRLGFVPREDRGMYVLLEWDPAVAGSTGGNEGMG